MDVESDEVGVGVGGRKPERGGAVATTDLDDDPRGAARRAGRREGGRRDGIPGQQGGQSALGELRAAPPASVEGADPLFWHAGQGMPRELGEGPGRLEWVRPAGWAATTEWGGGPTWAFSTR